MTTKSVIGLSNGNVMYLNFCQPLAPSTCAASMTSAGSEYSPAIYMTTAYPKSFQMVIIITAIRAVLGFISQLISSPNILLMIPICGLYMNFHTNATATIGVTTGI